VRGKIIKIVRDRSFGFISAENGKELFFHSSSVEDLDFNDLEEGNIVEFKQVKGRKGPQAENVTRVEQKKGWWTE
jgi:CspA family cold shock protein